MSRSRIYVLTACDCDPDRFRYGGTDHCSKDFLLWNGVAKGIPSIYAFMNNSKDSLGKGLKITWCVRCDEQLNHIYGEHGWAYKEFDHIWKYLRDSGHEIAWHPHFWRWSEEKALWYQEEQSDWINACLNKSFSEIPIKFKPLTSKTGWTHHCNESVKTLDNLGLTADVSPIPSLKSSSTLVGSGYAFGKYDWSITTKEPYHPSIGDYRVSGPDNYSILFIPATVFRLPFFYYLGKRFFNKFQSIIRQKNNVAVNYHLAPLSPTKPINAMINTISNAFELACNGNKIVFIHSYFHPDELLNNYGVFSKNNFFEYFRFIRSLSNKYNCDVIYTTANEMRCLY